jgi:hypothetical protein
MTMTGAMTATTGVGMDGAGFIGTATTGFTKVGLQKTTLALSESQRRNVQKGVLPFCFAKKLAQK